MHVMEHEYVTKGLTETALITLWVVLTKHFYSACPLQGDIYQVVPKHIMSFYGLSCSYSVLLHSFC